MVSWSFRGKSRVWSLVFATLHLSLREIKVLVFSFHYFTFVTMCSVWVSSLMSNVVLCNHSTYVDTLLQFFLQKLAPSWWSAKSVENWLWTLHYHGACFGFYLTYTARHTLIMASIHGPSIAAHPTSFQAHSIPSPRMGFHPDLEHSMVNIHWCYVLCSPDLYFFKVQQPEVSTMAHAGYVPDSYYGHKHTACLCAYFITHLFACNEYHGSSSKLPYFIAHALYWTKLHSSVAFTALLLLQRLSVHFPTACGSSGQCLFITAFMITLKAMSDNKYSISLGQSLLRGCSSFRRSTK